ncbi:MAG: hypothetical protein Q4D87_03095 [Actinomycetaceae bacterium]|nr:hypothetical protein [Actinomycetaceae bacterium]
MNAFSNERLYSLDYDWLWAAPPHNDGSEARLRVFLKWTLIDSSDDAYEGVPGGPLGKVVRDWLGSLPYSDGGIWGEGGWAASIIKEDSDGVVLDIWSAGEDVADGIEAGTLSLFEGVLRAHPVDVRYEQLPRV